MIQAVALVCSQYYGRRSSGGGFDILEAQHPDRVFICDACFNWSLTHDGKVPGPGFIEHRRIPTTMKEQKGKPCMISGCLTLMASSHRPRDAWIEAFETLRAQHLDGVFICDPCYRFCLSHNGRLPTAADMKRRKPSKQSQSDEEKENRAMQEQKEVPGLEEENAVQPCRNSSSRKPTAPLNL
jgi:hypothetical protein